MEKKHPYYYIVHLILFALALLFFFKLIEPVITVFLAATIITYVSFPLYTRLKKYLQFEFLSIMATLLIVIVILLLPFSYVTIALTQQTTEFYNSLAGNLEKGTVLGLNCIQPNSNLCVLIDNVEEFSANTLEGVGLDLYLQKFLQSMVNVVKNYLVKIPNALVGAGLALFVSYFLFIDGKNIVTRVANWLPLRKEDIDRMISQFSKITYTIVFAQLIVAFIQGIVGFVGMAIFGVPLALFWGVIMAFFALLPVIGTALVWVPISFYMILTGYLSQDYVLVIKGIGLMLYGFLVISTVDNVLRIKIIHAKAKVHPIIVIAGVIGGVSMFGIIGLFLGPILISMLITYFESFKENMM